MTEPKSAGEWLMEAVEEYLREWDTPAKDYAYRAACRERMRKAAAAYRKSIGMEDLT